MFNLRIATAACLVAMGLAAGRATARADDQQTIERARGLLKLLIDGECEALVAAGDDTMKEKFTAARARQIWTGLELQLGSYEAEESATLSQAGGHDVVRFVLRFERAKQPLRIVLDRQGRLAGLWLGRTESRATYEPPEYVDGESFREEKVTVSAGKYPLPGTLTIPVGDGPHAGVVLVHGSGPHDQDETVGAHKPFRDLAWGLASRGIAVLRYQKRTQAHPHAEKPDEWTLENETIEDALAAAELLRKRPEIDPQRVFVLGHSLGGVAAPYIAQRDDKLAGIIILAGSARSILDLLDEQTTYLAKLDGRISPEEQEQLDQLRKVTAAIREGRLDDVSADAGLPPRYLAALHKLNPPAAAARLDLPMLILQGGRDYQVTRADFALWQKHLENRRNATFKLFDDLNHLFASGEGPPRPEEYQQPGHVDRRVIETIAKWVERPGARR